MALDSLDLQREEEQYIVYLVGFAFRAFHLLVLQRIHLHIIVHIQFDIIISIWQSWLMRPRLSFHKLIDE